MSGETHQLLDKRKQKNFNFLEVVVATILCTVAFAAAFLLCGSWLRYAQAYVTIFLLVLLVLACVAATVRAIMQHRAGRPMRFWYAFIPILWIALLLGALYGDRNYEDYVNSYYTYSDMNVYANIDPETENGKSFMDAGRMYFTDSTAEITSAAASFQDNFRYCVAPILKNPNVSESTGVWGAVSEDGTITTPESGSVDFWSVGTDCCSTGGSDFDCGESNSYAGLRVVSTTDREMYQLAVELWSANYGVAVGNALFFSWVSDPITTIDGYDTSAWDTFLLSVIIVLVVCLICIFAIQFLLYKCGII